MNWMLKYMLIVASCFLAACQESQSSIIKPKKDLTQLYSMVIKEMLPVKEYYGMDGEPVRLNLIPIFADGGIHQAMFSVLIERYEHHQLDTLNHMDEYSVDTAQIESEFPVLIMDRAKFLKSNSATQLMITRPIVLDDSIFIVRANWYESPDDIHGRLYVIRESKKQLRLLEVEVDDFVE